MLTIEDLITFLQENFEGTEEVLTGIIHTTTDGKVIIRNGEIVKQ